MNFVCVFKKGVVEKSQKNPPLLDSNSDRSLELSLCLYANIFSPITNRFLFVFNVVTSLQVLGRSIRFQRLYALTDKFNTPIMVGFLNKAIIVRIPFSYKDKSEKQIKKKKAFH